MMTDVITAYVNGATENGYAEDWTPTRSLSRALAGPGRAYGADGGCAPLAQTYERAWMRSKKSAWSLLK